MNDKTIKQAVVTDQTSIDTSQVVELIALFNSDGTQVDLDSLQVQTGDNTLLTGYEMAAVSSAVQATDTVSEAIGKVTKFDFDLSARLQAIEPPYEVALTGYVIDGTGGALSATDTILEAIAKLEKRIDDLETS